MQLLSNGSEKEGERGTEGRGEEGGREKEQMRKNIDKG